MNIVIRKGETKDSKKLYSFNIKLQKEMHDLFKKTRLKEFAKAQLCDPKAYTSKDYEKWLNKLEKKSDTQTNNIWYIAEVNGKTIGEIYAEIKENRGGLVKKTGYIDSLYILKKYRNNGCASLLIKKAIEWFKIKKVKNISLSVDVVNLPAKNLYKQFGFKTIKNEMSIII